MPLSINQALTVSFPAVIADKGKAANQWEESAFLHAMDDQGMIKKVSLGPTIEAPLDYQRNPGAKFLASDLEAMSMSKTEVLTAASWTPGQLSIPITWSKMDEATNTGDTQKIKLVSSLITNALASHDDLIEQYIFQTSTNGFLGLLTHLPTSGLSSDGGIDSTTYAWWRNQHSTYTDDTDIEAAMTAIYMACAKGSGSQLMPTLIVSDGPTNALFQGTQQALQRWGKGDKLNAGFTGTIQFMNADYVYSPYGTTSLFFLNKKTFNLIVSRDFWMDMDDTMPLQNANGYTRLVYSALQTITTNRSRIGVLYPA